LKSNTTQLKHHHDRIIAWRAEGLNFRQIADCLTLEGVKVDHNAVYRYCNRAGIPTSPSPPKVPSPEVEIPEATPLVREAWQAPPRLFTPLDSGPWWTPDLTLLEFGEEKDATAWTLQDACEGIFITGATGSGKTSGSGATLARSFLEHGFGGIVLTVKPDERQLWERTAAECGRKEQLCIVEPGGRYRLNFLDYEARRPGVGSGLIENLVNLFYTVLEVHARSGGNQAAKDFWENAGKQLLRNVLRVLEQSRGRLSLEEIGRFLSEAPQSPEQAASGKWQLTKHFGVWLQQATARAKGTSYERVMSEARRYWLEEFPSLAKDTRSCLVTGLTAMADAFVEPAIHDLFCTDTTLIPESVTEGAIILINLPLKQYKTVGLFAQMIWKHLFQEAIERRSDPDDTTRRPVFLWADEAQFFYSAYDGLFQSTARSSRCATVYLTQNIPNFYGILGDSQARSKVDGFLGNLNTKIFHSNNDPTTNQWAAEQIGKCLTHRFSSSSGSSKKHFLDVFPTQNHSAGTQEVIDYEVQPSEFTKLRTGSVQNDRLVDAYFVKSGACFNATGKHYFKTIFQQELRT
jgi:hypothetical protein